MQQLMELTQVVILDDTDPRCNVKAIIDTAGNLNLQITHRIDAGDELVASRSSVEALPLGLRNIFYYYRNPLPPIVSSYPPTSSSSSKAQKRQ
jgi:hypothetical protein